MISTDWPWAVDVEDIMDRPGVEGLPDRGKFPLHPGVASPPPRPTGSPTGGKLYLMEHEKGFVKVGHSTSPRRRLRNLDVGPYEIELAYLIDIKRTPLPEIEAAVHQYLDEFHVRREWFELDVSDEMVQEIELLIRGYETFRESDRASIRPGDHPP